jgi:integrase
MVTRGSTVRVHQNVDGAPRRSSQARGAAIRVTVAALRSAFTFGILQCGLARNPVAQLERGELPSGARQTEPRYMTPEEVERLMEKLWPQTKSIAAVLFFAGARLGEALSLRWSDVKFDAAEIRIPGTKTKSSDAVVRLLPPLAAELRAHRERVAKEFGFSRLAPTTRSSRRGTASAPRRAAYCARINSASIRAGLVADGQQTVGPHDLRHSLPAYAFSLKLSPVEVARLLRHANPAITLSTYAGMAESVALAVGDKLAAGFGS